MAHGYDAQPGVPGGPDADETAERDRRLALLGRFGGSAGRLRAHLRSQGGVADLFADGVAVSAAADAVRRGNRVLLPGTTSFPKAVHELADPPALLFVAGRWPIEQPAVAIVGARAPDDYGIAVTRSLAAAAVAAGFAVVSGGAAGVDAVAHRAALEAGGQTVAVLGSGFERPYPAHHRGLFSEIAASGTLIAEYPPCRGPRAAQFPERNRLIAGMADVVLVTQARRHSGALTTARIAGALGRPVFAVPGDLCYRLSAGVAALFEAGARPVVSPQHWTAVLLTAARGGAGRALSTTVAEPPWERTATPPPVGGPPSSPAEDPVLRALEGGQARPVDDVVAASGLSTSEALQRIVLLELDGTLERLQDGRVRRGRAHTCDAARFPWWGAHGSYE